MNKTINALVFLVVVVLMVLNIHAVYGQYSYCKSNYEYHSITFSSMTCENHLPDGRVESSIQNAQGYGFSVVLAVILILFLARQSFIDFISNKYAYFGQNNIRRESYFLGIALFLYALVSAFLGFFISSFGFTIVDKVVTSPQSWLTLVVFSLAVSIPLAFSFYIGKKTLNSPSPTRVFYKMPLVTLIPSLILGTAVGISFGWTAFLSALVWLTGFFWIIEYMVCISIISFIFAIHLYLYSKIERRKYLRPLAIIVGILPITMIILGKNL